MDKLDIALRELKKETHYLQKLMDHEQRVLSVIQIMLIVFQSLMLLWFPSIFNAWALGFMIGWFILQTMQNSIKRKYRI